MSRAPRTDMRILAITLLAACASSPKTPPGGPRGLRATEHLAEARSHEQQARERPRWPDDSAAPGNVGMPWMRRWEPDLADEQSAAQHRARAADLQEQYEQACGDRSLAEVAVSPLQRYAIGAWPTATGEIMYLQPEAGPPDKLLADMKCHRAWMMLAPAGMENCPLDLPGIQLDARGDAQGIEVSIVVGTPELVEELHRRAALELEHARVR